MTETQVKAAIEIAAAVAQAIKELKTVPSGHLYARVMSHLSLDSYNSVIDMLMRNGLVRKNGQLLIWVGGDHNL